MTVARLFPSSLLGEMALLDPWGGKHTASVVAETHVEVLAVSRKQFDMSAASEAFLANVRRRSTHYPKHEDIERLAVMRRKWTAYKRDMIAHMKQDRWPRAREQLNLQHSRTDDHLLPSDLALQVALAEQHGRPAWSS